MTPTEVNRLEHASRSAMAWGPETDGRRQTNLLLVVMVPGLAMLVLAATLLAAML